MRIALIIVAAIVGLGVVVWIVGSLLPVKHRATRKATFAVPAESLFALITTPAKFPEWRKGVQRVELLPPVNGVAQYREVSSDGTILYAVVRTIPNRELVTEIADRSLPFGGRWTFAISPATGGATTLSITEDGEVYNPIFRFVSRFILGHHATIDRYLEDVKRWRS